MQRPGEPSTRHPGMGLRVLSLGPGSPVPGERLQLAIYDTQNTVVRRFEQVQGACLDPGYVDFFSGPNCRPASYQMPLVDIDADGNQTILVEHYEQSMGQERYLQALYTWVHAYGIPQEREDV